MKKYLIILTILLFVTGYGQTSLRKSSLSAGGGSATSGNLYMVYAMGEIGTKEADQGNMHLSEGFIGPDFAALLGIEDYTQLQGVKVYPNPVSDFINIKFPETGDYEVYVFDITGKQVLKNILHNNDIVRYSIKHLKTGYYLLTLIDRKGNKTITYKIQKL